MDWNRLIERIKLDESGSLQPQFKPYKDSKGILTIGYGRNLEDRGINYVEAEMMFNRDLIDAMSDAEKFFPGFKHLSSLRQEVLVNMAFNLGLTRLNGFIGFKEALEKGDFKKASIEMLDSKWRKDVGKRAYRLAYMMLNDKVPTEGELHEFIGK